MKHAMIMAGGSGTRLWPMSRAEKPKQLLPFIEGKSLLQIAFGRLEGLVPVGQRFVCAGLRHRSAVLESLEPLGFDQNQYLGEPTGRDTLNAVGLSAAVIARRDPDAVMAVFTADHIIEPVDRFQQIVAAGYELAATSGVLVTFGITPTQAATGYGYLQLGKPLEAGGNEAAFAVEQFREKPDAAAAQEYLDAGPDQYLWNSGMFVWRADTLLACIEQFEPEVHAGLMKIADAWETESRDQVLDQIYPTLKKISIDYAVMEPASRADGFTVAALAMPVTWLDVGSWPSFAQTCPKDEAGNAIGAAKHLLIDSTNTLVVSSDPDHLIAIVGCKDLVIVHTPEVTMVCPADQAEQIKALHGQVGKKFGPDLI